MDEPEACDRCGEPIDADEPFYKLEVPGRVMCCCEICHDDLESMDDDEFTDEVYGH